MLHLVTVIYGRSDNNRLCMITTVDVLHQINNTTAVSILIVIPITNIGTNKLKSHDVNTKCTTHKYRHNELKSHNINTK